VIAGDLSRPAFAARMAGGGVSLSMSPLTVRVRSTIGAFAAQLHGLYRDYELVPEANFAHVDTRIVRLRNAIPWRIAQVQFVVDGTAPFDPFPLAHALPMFEWGLNWVFAQRNHTFLLLHAAAVERDGRALLLPAYPGAGKSTLAASLACRGWRLLSDEFGVVADAGDDLVPFPRPPAIKNASIEVIRAFAPEASFGTVYHATRKGSVSHMRVPRNSIERSGERAQIAAVVFPEFRSGESIAVERLGQADAFMRLARHAFNYEVVGEHGFRAVAAIIRRCACHSMRYGNLDDAHEALDNLFVAAAP
jgi:HprK-related kinase A